MIKRGIAVVRFALDHPVLSSVAVSFSAMSLVVGIEALEKGRPPNASVALVKQGLCLIAIPGFLVLMFWTPGLTKKDAASRVPKWFLPAAGASVAAIVFYHALKIFLAAR